MKLPFFGKGKDGDPEGEEPEEELSDIDKMILEGVEAREKGEGEVEETPTVDPSMAKDQALTKLGMDVDRLKAQIEAQKQIREMNEQRFKRLNEEIGDLRRRGMEREKDIDVVKVKAMKASELVETVQPQKLMMEVKRLDARIEQGTAKQEMNKKLIDKLFDAQKEMKNVIGAFKGVESLVELHDEVKAELRNVQKTQLIIERHSNKVEQIFVNIQKRFGQFQKLSTEFQTLEKTFNEVLKDAESFKVDKNELITKAEFVKLKNEVEGKLADAEKIQRELKAIVKQSKTLVEDMQEIKGLTGKIQDISKKVDGLDERIGQLVERQFKAAAGEREKEIYGLKSEINEHIKAVEARMNGLVSAKQMDKELADMFKNIMNKINKQKKTK